MNTEKQIKALAELDGLDPKYINGNWYVHPDVFPAKQLTSYLTSYNAIIPLIQKQERKILVRLILSFKQSQNDVARMSDWLMFTPAQLCEALLRATGKWEV